MINISGFAGPLISAVITCSMRDNRQTKRRACVPLTLYLHQHKGRMDFGPLPQATAVRAGIDPG